MKVVEASSSKGTTEWGIIKGIVKGIIFMEEKKKLSFGQAMILLLIAVVMIFIVKAKVGGDTSVSLLCAAAAVSALAMIWGIKWEDIEYEVKENFKSMASPLMILMCVGLLVGTWMISGSIPTMIYYGMKFLSPGIFLVMACIIAAVMFVMTGTSWGTVSTVGVALMRVSAGLGIPATYTAGAVTAGALFGDKLSPLSDTTVMASAVAEVNIVDHIKYMLLTTVPSIVVSLVLYGILGAKYAGQEMSGADYSAIMNTLHDTFTINPIMLIPPVIVVTLIVLKKPTIPTFFSGILAAMVLAWVFQGASFSDVIYAMGGGYTESTGVEIVDTMVLRGGLNSMLSTIVLVLAAGVFGGPLKASGTVEIIVEKLSKAVKSDKQMMITVAILHLVLFLIVVSYYISFVVIGNMTKDLYDKFGLKRTNLSRMLEDTGTAAAPLIPWSLSGAFYSSTLGLPVWDFVLYAPITYLGMGFALVYILTGVTIARTDEGKQKKLKGNKKKDKKEELA
ncbi:MAG: Na+/H+ antiporter NhaC [Anaerovoracaceae bacterium]|nr:Na+/H+ antiporter NhaC [Anaerovoracaceae bacterium]